MKSPWVSRALYTAALERIDAEREVAQFLRRDVLNSAEHWSALVKKADARHDDLLARYHMLRLQGYVPVAPPEPVAPVDPIIAAIAQASGGDPELRRMMEGQAMADRASGKTDGDILAAIHLGQSATDGTFI